MQILFSTSGLPLRGFNKEEDYTINLVSAPEYIPGTGNSSISIQDLTYTINQGSGYYSKSNINISQSTNNPSVMLTSLTPSVCTVDPAGTTTRISDGYCAIKAVGQTGARTIGFSIQPSNGAIIEYISIDNRAEGSLRKYLYDQTVAALADVTPGSATQRASVLISNYTTNSGANANTVTMGGGTYGGPNLNNFLRAQSKPGFHSFNTTLLDQILCSTGTAAYEEWKMWLSPRHYLTWNGHTTDPGTATNWRRVANSEATIVYSATEWTGPLVKLPPIDLDSYLPAPVMLSNGADTHAHMWARLFHTYIGGAGTTYAGVDANISERRWVYPVSISNRPFKPDHPLYLYQKQEPISKTLVTGGDSGSPGFIGINGEIVAIMYCPASGSPGGIYTHVGKEKAAIDSTMATLSALNNDANIYTSQVIDLTQPIPGYPNGFTKYL